MGVMGDVLSLLVFALSRGCCQSKRGQTIMYDTGEIPIRKYFVPPLAEQIINFTENGIIDNLRNSLLIYHHNLRNLLLGPIPAKGRGTRRLKRMIMSFGWPFGAL